MGKWFRGLGGGGKGNVRYRSLVGCSARFPPFRVCDQIFQFVEVRYDGAFFDDGLELLLLRFARQHSSHA